MSQIDPMNLEMGTQNSGAETIVATTATETDNFTQQSAEATAVTETPKGVLVAEGRNMIASTSSTDAISGSSNSTGATTAVDMDSSSEQPILVNGHTEAPISVSVEAGHDGVGVAEVDDTVAKNGSSEGVTTAADNQNLSQPLAFVNGHTELPNPTSVGSANIETSPTALDNAKVKLEESEDAVAPAPKPEWGEGAEWQIDSSPIQSSSSDTSSDSSSSSEDSDDSGDDDYTLLDPAEQARMLMEGDGGSDDEGGKKGDKGTGGGQLRTKNEKPYEVVEKPDIKVMPDMVIEELGIVENTVEDLILIKAKISGEYRVLETGSVLCLEDRAVIGVVAETLGRVQQPYYSVRFTNAAGITEAGIAKDTKIFYVEQHSTYVFTQSLKALKGSDASNLHDEEVGEDEMEFSDDEAEAEYKRRAKQDRRARKDARFGTNGGSIAGERNVAPRFNGPRQDVPMSYEANRELKYEDNDGDELYTPLARPPNLHEMMGRGGIPIEGRTAQAGANRGLHGNRAGNDRGRARGDRGRGGRSGRGDRGRERSGRGSGFQKQNGAGRATYQDQQQQYSYGAPPMSPAAPPPFSTQQTDQSPQTDTYSPQPSFQQTYPQQAYPPPHPAFPPPHQAFPPPHQAFPPPHQSPQPTFSMPTTNYYAQQQQHYSPRQPYQPPQPYPSSPQVQHQQHQHQHQYSQPYQYPPYQPTLQRQQHPRHFTQDLPHHQPTPNPSLPPGAFLNPAFFRNQSQAQQAQPQPQLPPQQHPSAPNRYPAPTSWSPSQPLQQQYPAPNQWPAQTAYESGSGYGPGPGHGQGPESFAVGQGQMQGQGQGQGQGQEAAFRAAQEKLDILRGLGGGGGDGGGGGGRFGGR